MKTRTVLTLAGLAALAMLATNILLPSLPRMGRYFGVGDSGMNAALSVFLAVFAVAQLVAGPWSDRIGRRPVIVGGMLVFLAGTLISASATSLGLLLTGRAIQALGAAASVALARAIARDLHSGPALARLLGLIMVVTAAAPGFSPLLGGVIDRYLGWRAVFAAVGVLGLFVAAGYLVAIGETLPPQRRVARSVREIATEYAALIRDPRFMVPALGVALITGALFAVFAASPSVLTQRFSFDAVQIGLFFSATVFVVFAASTAAPRLSARFGAISTFRGGLLLALAGGAIMLVAAQYTPGTLSVYVASICTFLFGMGLVTPTGTAQALTPYASAAGQASALLGFLQMTIAALASSVAMGASIDRMSALGLVLGGCAIVALLVSTNRKPAPAPAA